LCFPEFCPFQAGPAEQYGKNTDKHTDNKLVYGKTDYISRNIIGLVEDQRHDHTGNKKVKRRGGDSLSLYV